MASDDDLFAWNPHGFSTPAAPKTATTTVPARAPATAPPPGAGVTRIDSLLSQFDAVLHFELGSGTQKKKAPVTPAKAPVAPRHPPTMPHLQVPRPNQRRGSLASSIASDADLRHQIQSQHDTIAALRQQLAELVQNSKETYKSRARQLKTLQQAKQTLAKELSTAHAECTRWKEQTADVQRQLADTQRREQGARVALQAAEQEKQSLSSAIVDRVDSPRIAGPAHAQQDHAVAENIHLKARLRDLAMQLEQHEASAHAQVAAVTTQRDEARERVAHHTRQGEEAVADANAREEALQAQLKDHARQREQERTDANARQDALQAQLAHAHQALQDAQQRTPSPTQPWLQHVMEQTLSAVAVVEAQLVQHADAMGARVATAEASLVQASSAIANQQAAHTEAMQELRKKHTATRHERAKLIAAIKKQKVAHQRADTLIHTLTEKIKTNAAAAEEKYTALQQDKATEAGELQRNHHMEALEAQVADMTRQRDEALAALAQVKHDAADQHDEQHTTLVQERDAALQDAQHATQELTTLVQERDAALQDAQHATQELTTLVQERDAALADAQTVAQQLKELQQSVVVKEAAKDLVQAEMQAEHEREVKRVREEANQQITALGELLTVKSSQLEQAAGIANVEETIERARAVLAERDAAVQSMTEQQARLEAVQQQLESVRRDQAQVAEEEAVARTSALEEVRAQGEAMRQQCETLQDAMEALKQERDRAQEEARTGVEALTAKLSTAVQEREAVEKEHHAQVADLEERLAAAVTSSEQATKERIDATQRVEVLQKERAQALEEAKAAAMRPRADSMASLSALPSPFASPSTSPAGVEGAVGAERGLSMASAAPASVTSGADVDSMSVMMRRNIAYKQQNLTLRQKLADVIGKYKSVRERCDVLKKRAKVAQERLTEVQASPPDLDEAVADLFRALGAEAPSDIEGSHDLLVQASRQARTLVSEMATLRAAQAKPPVAPTRPTGMPNVQTPTESSDALFAATPPAVAALKREASADEGYQAFVGLVDGDPASPTPANAELPDAASPIIKIALNVDASAGVAETLRAEKEQLERRVREQEEEQSGLSAQLETLRVELDSAVAARYEAEAMAETAKAAAATSAPASEAIDENGMVYVDAANVHVMVEEGSTVCRVLLRGASNADPTDPRFLAKVEVPPSPSADPEPEATEDKVEAPVQEEPAVRAPMPKSEPRASAPAKKPWSFVNRLLGNKKEYYDEAKQQWVFPGEEEEPEEAQAEPLPPRPVSAKSEGSAGSNSDGNRYSALASPHRSAGAGVQSRYSNAFQDVGMGAAGATVTGLPMPKPISPNRDSAESDSDFPPPKIMEPTMPASSVLPDGVAAATASGRVFFERPGGEARATPSRQKAPKEDQEVREVSETSEEANAEPAFADEDDADAAGGAMESPRLRWKRHKEERLRNMRRLRENLLPKLDMGPGKLAPSSASSRVAPQRPHPAPRGPKTPPKPLFVTTVVSVADLVQTRGGAHETVAQQAAAALLGTVPMEPKQAPVTLAASANKRSHEPMAPSSGSVMQQSGEAATRLLTMRQRVTTLRESVTQLEAENAKLKQRIVTLEVEAEAASQASPALSKGTEPKDQAHDDDHDDDDDGFLLRKLRRVEAQCRAARQEVKRLERERAVAAASTGSVRESPSSSSSQVPRRDMLQLKMQHQMQLGKMQGEVDKLKDEIKHLHLHRDELQERLRAGGATGASSGLRQRKGDFGVRLTYEELDAQKEKLRAENEQLSTRIEELLADAGASVRAPASERRTAGGRVLRYRGSMGVFLSCSRFFVSAAIAAMGSVALGALWLESVDALI